MVLGPPSRCIAHARSGDLVHWEVLPPVVAPGDFGHMEVPQFVGIGERYYLLFSSEGEVHSADRHNHTGQAPVTGTHYLVADDPLGPYRYVRDEFLVGDTVGLRTGVLGVVTLAHQGFEAT